VKPLRLRVTPPSGAPFLHDCAEPVLVLGRSRSTDVTIPDQYLSRLHARLCWEGDGWLLEDLGSHNPTLLNGRPVSGRARVSPGDVLRLGATLVAVEEATAERVPPSGVFKSAADLQPEATVWDPHEGEAARRVTARLKLVNEVHRALAGSTHREHVLERILDSAFTHLEPEEGAVFLRTPAGKLERVASRRLPGMTGDFLYSTSLVREVTDRRMAALVDDFSADERFAEAHSILSAGVRSLIAAPLLDGDDCLGMIALNSRLHVRRFSEEDLELLVLLASAAALRLRNLALVEEAARHLLLEKELNLARDVQMTMLPTRFPRRAEFEVAAALRPAHAVGGDLYDCVDDERRLWLLIGDVSGKGFPAALLMAVTRTLFRTLIRTEPSPAAVLGAMNRELARDNESGMFITAFAACLAPESGELAFANAGHNRPYVLSPDGSLLRLEEAAGIALGVVGTHAYEAGRRLLSPGEALYLYTDGVTEALAPGHQQYSEERLEQCLRGLAGAPADEIVARSLAAVQEFSGRAPQSDDIAILAVRYLRP
jgi:serine phosphatase RsbU (regulator of sigma subunit)